MVSVQGPVGPVGKELVQAGEDCPVPLRLLGERGAHLLMFDKPASPDAPGWDELSPSERAEQWHRLDHHMELEQYIGRTHEWARILSAPSFGLFEQAVASYHDTLPFAPAERRWLADEFVAIPWRRQFDPTDSDAQVIEDQPTEIAALRALATTLMVSGRPKTVTGNELLQRWWSWRRGVNEFEGTQSHGRATRALRELATLTIVEVPPIIAPHVGM